MNSTRTRAWTPASADEHRDLFSVLRLLYRELVPIATKQLPQLAENTIAAGFVEHLEASHVGWNVAKVVTLGILHVRASAFPM